MCVSGPSVLQVPESLALASQCILAYAEHSLGPGTWPHTYSLLTELGCSTGLSATNVAPLGLVTPSYPTSNQSSFHIHSLIHPRPEFSLPSKQPPSVTHSGPLISTPLTTEINLHHPGSRWGRVGDRWGQEPGWGLAGHLEFQNCRHGGRTDS